MSEASINQVLRLAHGLTRFDASGCPNLECIEAWPSNLERIDLNDCLALRTLPDWPNKGLRRVGLRRASLLGHVPELPALVDYLDLAHTEGLLELPKFNSRPRTLFLYGSGVLVPPASEHGKTDEENVAARTWEFFDDKDLVGEGEVLRCKLLVLGNSGAGKTTLSLALKPGGNPSEAEGMGTTHAVQFWEWDIRAEVKDKTQDVHLHVWDFGGQDIYHNTHRLFMGRGAVFVVVWNPKQDSMQPKHIWDGVTDVPRPLQYWLDFIHIACPHKPRIAIVCSHQTQVTEAMKAAWKDQVDARYQDLAFFQVDSMTRGGEFEGMRRWLRRHVGDVVTSQGTVVPSHWEVAQEMVNRWLKSDHHVNRMPKKDFGDQFREAIRVHGKGKLATASRRGDFELTTVRVERTLEFLTNSGWVYWDRNLMGEDVIIGQKWALLGIYSVLDPRPDKGVYDRLARAAGRFTASDLGDILGPEFGGPEERDLLLSFMVLCNVCFRLRKAEDAWRDEDVYVSYQHLASSAALGLRQVHDRHAKAAGEAYDGFDAPRAHSGDWQSFLVECGRQFGADASYARDGIWVKTEDGASVLVLCTFLPVGLGASIQVRVASPDAADRLGKVMGFVRGFFPGEKRAEDKVDTAIGKASQILEVFISYKQDKEDDAGDPKRARTYSAPVDAIESHLKNKGFSVLRDTSRLKRGSDLVSYVRNGPKSPRVIVVYSDLYWRSPWCIYELWHAMHELMLSKDRSMAEVIVPVEHVGGALDEEDKLNACLEHWRRFGKAPTALEWKSDEFRDHAPSLIKEVAKVFHGRLDYVIRWGDGTTALPAIEVRMRVPFEFDNQHL